MEKWQAIAALSALSLKAADNEWISSCGGPLALFSFNQNLLEEKLSTGKRKQRISIEEAFTQANSLNNFLQSGGTIAGVDGVSSLGRLQRAPQAPLCAFVRGSLQDLDHCPTVAIIGTRKPTRRGLDRCVEITKYLAGIGCHIVSGGAMGIDYIAHKTALSSGTRTVVVLGDPVKISGDERCSRILSLTPLEQITCISPYGPWIPAANFLYAARNQYIAALADAVVVVEGLAKSGTLHTAHYAHRMNVPVWVIPGDLQDPFAGAANVLLEAGHARALINPDTLAKSLGKAHKPIVREKMPKVESTKLAGQSQNLPKSSELVEALRSLGGRASYDELCAFMTADMAKIQSDMSYLEIMGVVQKIGAELVLTGN